MAVALLCSVQNFNMIGWHTKKFWTNEISWDLSFNMCLDRYPILHKALGYWQPEHRPSSTYIYVLALEKFLVVTISKGMKAQYWVFKCLCYFIWLACCNKIWKITKLLVIRRSSWKLKNSFVTANLVSARAQLSKLEHQRVLPPNCGQIMKKTTPVHLSQLPDNPPNFSFAQHFLFQ